MFDGKLNAISGHARNEDGKSLCGEMEPSIAIQLSEWTLMNKSYSGKKIPARSRHPSILEELHLCFG